MHKSEDLPIAFAYAIVTWFDKAYDSRCAVRPILTPIWMRPFFCAKAPRTEDAGNERSTVCKKHKRN